MISTRCSRPLAWVAAALATAACCDDSQRSMSLIPWGDAGSVPPPTFVVGDSLPVGVEVTGHATGFFFSDQCLLYDLRSDRERFEFTLSDTAVASISPGPDSNYLVARRPGSAVLTVSTSGLPDIELPFTVVADSAEVGAAGGAGE